MFGIFAPESVQFIDLQDAIITFLSRGKKTPGQAVKVRFPLPGNKPPKIDLPIRITAIRPAQGIKGFICVGFVAVPEEKLANLEEALRSYAPRPDLGISGRRSPRLPISLRVMARELPGFGAVTIDISNHGVRLNCHGAVKQGLVVTMVIESDVASVENMHLRGRIIWSRENTGGRGHLAGLEFFDLNPTQADALERYNKSLAGRLRGDVMHRQIADGEIVVRPEDPDAVVAPPKSLNAPPPPPPPPL